MEKVYFDCGIIKNVIHKNRIARSNTFYSEIRKRKVLTTQQPFFIFSSLVLIELIGLKMDSIIKTDRLHRQLDALKASTNGNVSNNQLLADYFSSIKDLFYLEQLLTRNFLKDGIKNEMEYRDSWGKGLLKEIFLKGVREKQIRLIHQDLALELVQCVEYEKYFEGEDLIGINIQLFRTYLTLYLLKKVNIPFFRIIAKAYEQITSSQLLVPFQELADCEIVHFSLLGHWSDDEVSSVKIFTTEGLASWKSRINAALAFIKFSNETIIPENNKFESNPKLEPLLLKPGKIFYVDPQTGNIGLEILDVREYVENVS